MSQASQTSEISAEFLALPEVQEHLERIDAEAEAMAGSTHAASTPDSSPSKRCRITATPKAQEFSFLKTVAAKRDTENSVFDASTSSNIAAPSDASASSSNAIPSDPFQFPGHLLPSQTAATAQYLLQRLSASPHPQHPGPILNPQPSLLDSIGNAQFTLAPTFFGHHNTVASALNPEPRPLPIPPPPSSQLCPEPLMAFTEPLPPLQTHPEPPSPPPSQIHPEPLSHSQPALQPLQSETLWSESPHPSSTQSGSDHHDAMDVGDDGSSFRKRLIEETFGEIDNLFETTLLTSGSNGNTFAERRGGRLTKDQLRAIEQGFAKIDQAFSDLSAITKLEVPVLLARYYALINDLKSAKFHCWNAYQNYAVDEENKLIELARIGAKNVDWEPGQLQDAYVAFMKYYGDAKASEILKLWQSSKPLSETQLKAQRRRVFENAVHQLESLGDRLRNLYQIHLFALMVGSQVQNDQSLQHIYQKFESAGFSEKGYLMDAELLIGAFKTHV
ncbi:hypothetical protein AAF712_012737 [Marasmius tenuissimus]|uniref:Uncharacterized protein n=1 Tax=Marasmius tenuissimus TaxID=585030 RepID=A0ABR2ZGX8_9AGAR